MQKKNECGCKLTLCYTRFSIGFRCFWNDKFHRRQKNESVLLCEYNAFFAECLYSLQPHLLYFICSLRGIRSCIVIAKADAGALAQPLKYFHDLTGFQR